MPSVYEESVCESLSSKPGMETYLVSGKVMMFQQLSVLWSKERSVFILFCP